MGTAMLTRGSPLAGLRPFLAARRRLLAIPEEPRRPLGLSSVRGGGFFRGEPAGGGKGDPFLLRLQPVLPVQGVVRTRAAEGLASPEKNTEGFVQ